MASQLASVPFLPRAEEAWAYPQRKYQGFWISENYLPRMMGIQDRFKPRPTDLILASYPKSGTTWLKSLLFTVVNRTRYSFDQHPLLKQNPHDCVPFLEVPYPNNRLADLEALPSPRLLATHIPFSLLPASVADSGCRLVYVCRDPKDVVVSLWHFGKKMRPDVIDFDPFFQMFCEGISLLGPAWEHNLDYWRASQRWPEKVLFLKYEEIMAEPGRNVRRLAEFVGYPFSEEEERDGVVEEVVRQCSFKKMSNLEVSKSGDRSLENLTFKNSSFFREGKVGDWVNHLRPEMAETLDRIVQQKLHGSGLTYQQSYETSSF